MDTQLCTTICLSQVPLNVNSLIVNSLKLYVSSTSVDDYLQGLTCVDPVQVGSVFVNS